MPVYKGSRYSLSSTYPMVSSNGAVVTVLGSRNDEIKTDKTDLVHIVQQGDRLDLLARDYLGDPQLGWVILDSNPTIMSEAEIVPGTRLVIPSMHRIPRGVI